MFSEDLSEIANAQSHTCFSFLTLTMALNFLSGFLLLTVQLLFMGQMKDNLGFDFPSNKCGLRPELLLKIPNQLNLYNPKIFAII